MLDCRCAFIKMNDCAAPRYGLAAVVGGLTAPPTDLDVFLAPQPHGFGQKSLLPHDRYLPKEFWADQPAYGEICSSAWAWCESPYGVRDRIRRATADCNAKFSIS